jgi:hypothetical protein
MALVVVLVTVAVIAGLTTLMFTRTLAEMGHSRDDSQIVQTLMLARGAANVGNAMLWGPLQRILGNVVSDQASTTNPWSIGDTISGNTTNPEPQSVATKLDQIASAFQPSVDQLICTGGNTPLNVAPAGSGTATLRLYFTSTACGKPLPSGIRLPEGRFVSGNQRTGTGSNFSQVYSLPFVLVAVGNNGTYSRNVVVQGEYRFVVQGANFARYAYFTNIRQTGLYFQDADLVDGPVHSNQYLRFSGRPWFGDDVTVAGCQNPTLTACGTQYQGDDFGSDGFKTVSQIGANGGPCFVNTCPTFGTKVSFTASYIPLPTGISNQQALAQASGLYFNSSLTDLMLFAGCTDGSGNPLDLNGNRPPSTTSSGSCSSPAPFQFIRACTAATSCTLYRFSSNGTLQQATLQGSGYSWQNVVRSGSNVTFNGVIFVNGTIQDLGGPTRSNSSDPATAPPALSKFAQISVFSNGIDPGGSDNIGSIQVTRDLKYEDAPCTGSPNRSSVTAPVTRATCNNLNAQNILGVYSQNGSVTFGDTPTRLNNLTAQGVFMSGSQRVGVTDYCNGNQGGQLRILGGIIGNKVSGFGCGSSGYNRSITYDQRMRNGMAPPYFPTTTVANVPAVFTLTFGQREQVNLN